MKKTMKKELSVVIATLILPTVISGFSKEILIVDLITIIAFLIYTKIKNEK